MLPEEISRAVPHLCTGACLVNAYIGSFFATLRKELVYQTSFANRDAARLVVSKVIRFTFIAAPRFAVQQLAIERAKPAPLGIVRSRAVAAIDVLTTSGFRAWKGWPLEVRFFYSFIPY